jgi:hypothetical protein
MPKPTIDDVAQAVVGRLAAGVAAERFDTTFTPRFSRIVKFDLKEDAIDVVVVGFSRRTSVEGRDTDGRDYRIEIGIGKKLPKRTDDEDDETETASLVKLVEDVADYLRETDGRIDENDDEGEWTEIEGADWTESEIEPLYDHAQLQDLRQFVSTQFVTYSVPVDLDGGGA